EAMLLPKMVPVGDLDPDELAFRSDEGDAAGTGFDLPPAVPPLRRQLLLTRLVSAFAGRTGESVPLGQAAQLAASLARFLDEAQTEGCDFAKLAALVPERLAKHWQEILTFLGIVTEHWPRMLEDLGCLDPAEWRNRMLAAQIAAWRQDPPAEPVIAAGLTGGIPAVAALMAAVALLPQGAVVLPGLDALADGALWEAVAKDPAHPQHLMCRFLESLELQPAAVKPWVGAFLPSARGRLVGEALAPAELSHRWRFVGAGDARPRSRAAGRGRAEALEHRHRRFGGHSAQQDAARRVPEARPRSRGAAPCAAAAARRAEAPARRRRHGAWRVPRDRAAAGARSAARAAPGSGNRRAAQAASRACARAARSPRAARRRAGAAARGARRAENRASGAARGAYRRCRGLGRER